MLCKNCNYILTGKENFCPNCASPLNEKTVPAQKNGTYENPKEVKTKRDEQRESVFIKKDEKYADDGAMSIFYDMHEKEEKPVSKNKSYAGRIFLLLIIVCALTATTFAVADYFELTPAVFRSISPSREKDEVTTQDYYRHENSIVKPDVSYSPVTAFVMSGEGVMLRKGPGNSYAPLEKVNDLSVVEVYGTSLTDKKWVYVYCAEKESYGWIDGSFITAKENQELTLPLENVPVIPSSQENEENKNN